MTHFKESKEAKIHIELWDFHKKYYNADTDENTWKTILSEAQKIYEKYDRSKFCKDMLSTVILHLNEQATKK